MTDPDDTQEIDDDKPEDHHGWPSTGLDENSDIPPA
jgi:hypothetical protein